MSFFNANKVHPISEEAAPNHQVGVAGRGTGAHDMPDRLHQQRSFSSSSHPGARGPVPFYHRRNSNNMSRQI